MYESSSSILLMEILEIHTTAKPNKAGMPQMLLEAGKRLCISTSLIFPHLFNEKEIKKAKGIFVKAPYQF